jgi:hypothetical protein
MTARTNRHLGGQHLGGTDDVTPSTLEQRRQLAVQRYLDGDLIETICHEMGCGLGQMRLCWLSHPGRGQGSADQGHRC